MSRTGVPKPISLQITPALSVDVIRKEIKHLYLAVIPPKGDLRVTVPLCVSDKRIRLFVVSKLDWAYKHQQKYSEYKSLSPRVYRDGEQHYFEGRSYALKIVEETSRPKVLVQVIGGLPHIILYVKPKSAVEHRQRVLREWYRAELKMQIPPMIRKWEAILGVRVQDWRVRFMRTRWGTCNTRAKRIWLNLELAKYSLHCLEYVLLHEMLHIMEWRHNARFYALMDKYMPDWKLHEETLLRFPKY